MEVGFFSEFEVQTRCYFRCYLKIAKNEAKKVYKNNALVAQLNRALDYELKTDDEARLICLNSWF